jgi:molecular chaperone DnaK
MSRSIDISNELLKRNNLSEQDLISVILIGGPTYSQTFRKMLRDHLSPKIDTSVDPMTAVAKGAALFASTRDIPSKLQQRDKGKVQLILKYTETTIETEENVGIKVDRGNTTGNIPSQIFIELSRNDGAWSSGKVHLEGDAEIIEVKLMQGKPNGYSIKLYDEKGNALVCEPSTFIIIQGIRVPDATLTYSIGIEAIDSSKGKACFHSIPGLERNKTLPAKGKIPLKTQKAIRPGNSSDFLSIPILEAMHDAEGTPAILHERAKTIKISGEDIPQYLPEDSEVEIRINVDSSRRMSASFYFKYIDHTIDSRDIDIDKTEELQKEELDEEIQNAGIQIDALDIDELNHLVEHAEKMKKELDYLEGILKKGGNESDTKNQVKEGIRRVLKEIDKIEDEIEWPQRQKELDAALNDLIVNSARYGDERAEGIVEDFEKKKMDAIYHKNSKIARQLKDQIEGFEFMLLSQDIGFWIGFVKHYDVEIDNVQWKDKDEAIRLIQQAKEAIGKKPTKEQIESIVRKIWELLIEKHIQITGKVRENLLKR